MVVAPTRAESDAAATLCFFSLNDLREFTLTRSFLEKADHPGMPLVKAVELHDPGVDDNPATSFRNMATGTQTCDGLVVSGHHTGSFGGRRARGVLDIDFLEQLSCKPQYREFFRKVRAVWLQGCRTLGVGPSGLVPGADSELQADYHMQRVGAELMQDGLQQSFSDLSTEFSSTLDPDNPLASRYQRVFPAANVFGWTRSSPGERARSERSLLFHMAHMVRLSGGTPLFNPLTEESSALKASMSRSLRQLLEGETAYGPLARESWLSHGRVKDSRFGFDNPDLNAYGPLLLSSREDLLQAGAVGCDLRNAPDFGELQQALHSILSNQAYVAYNLDAIWSAFIRYRERQSEQYEALRNQLVSSTALVNLLINKLNSPRTGLLMKIEYYSFYRDLTGNVVNSAEAQIRDHVSHFLLARDLAGSPYDIRDFRESLLLAVEEHRLADTAFYQDLLRAPEADDSTLYALTWTFVKQSPREAELIINDVVHHPQAKSGSLRGAALWLMIHGPSGKYDALEAIISHPLADQATLGTAASVLAEHNPPLCGELARDIVGHPRSGSPAISQVALAMRKGYCSADRALMEEVVSHPAIDRWGLQNAARAIAKNRELGSTDIFRTIVSHPQADAKVLSSVAFALWGDSYDGEPEILSAIRDDPRANDRTLRYVDRALARNQALVH